MPIYQDSYSDFMESAPHWLTKILPKLKKWVIPKWSTDSDGITENDVASQTGPEPVGELWMAEAVSSELDNGTHMILLDIDVPCVLIPSSRPGHSHLYIWPSKGGIDWLTYRALLDALLAAGVLEKGYVRNSVRRRGTFLRLPWIRKGHEAEDRQRALGEWLDEEPSVPFPDPQPF